ncbi:MAG: hypothetical protein ACC628_17105 [Pirellulaceae bacterium]
MSDPVQTAMERFEVPAGHERFLFCLPLFYVAKADGAIAMKEVVSIAWNSVMQGLVQPGGDEQKAFNAFYKNKTYQFQGKSNLDDFAILADAIDAQLAQYPAAEAQKIRDSIRAACTNVAQSSGPLFRDKVSAEERQMLDKIFATL